MSTTVPAVYAAIANVMAAIGKEGIAKDRRSQQQNYRFRGIDDVYNALNGYLAMAGLVILPRVVAIDRDERKTRDGGALLYSRLTVEFDFVAVADGSRHVVTTAGEAMDSGDKATNKAMSAAYKYACMQVFCIPTEGDNDADATTHEVEPKVRMPANDAPAVANIDVLKAEGAARARAGMSALGAWFSGLSNSERALVNAYKDEVLKPAAVAADNARKAGETA